VQCTAQALHIVVLREGCMTAQQDSLHLPGHDQRRLMFSGAALAHDWALPQWRQLTLNI
jgi:hypothetical protein